MANTSDNNLVRNQSFPLEYTISKKPPYFDPKLNDGLLEEIPIGDYPEKRKDTNQPFNSALSLSSHSLNEKLALTP